MLAVLYVSGVGGRSCIHLIRTPTGAGRRPEGEGFHVMDT